MGALIPEKVTAKGVKPNKIELFADGMMVRFAYHNPRWYFFDTADLHEFVLQYERLMEQRNGHLAQNERQFDKERFHIKMLTGNRVELVMAESVSGHNRITMAKDLFIRTLKEMYQK